MDALDREIEEAARDARRRVWRGRIATIASTATLLVVAAVWMIGVSLLFPGPAVREYDRVHGENLRRGDATAAAVADEGLAYEHDRMLGRVKYYPGCLLGVL